MKVAMQTMAADGEEGDDEKDDNDVKSTGAVKMDSYGFEKANRCSKHLQGGANSKDAAAAADGKDKCNFASHV